MTLIRLNFKDIGMAGLTGTFSAVLLKPLILPEDYLPAGEEKSAQITNGLGAIDLTPSQPYGIFYEAYLTTPQARHRLGRFQVPASGTEVKFSDIVAQTPITPDNWDSSIRAIINRLLVDPEFLALVSSGGLMRELLAIAPGQTEFTLTPAPVKPHLSELFLNGVKATYGTEYMINGSQLIWLMSLPLAVTDELEIYYRI